MIKMIWQLSEEQLRAYLRAHPTGMRARAIRNELLRRYGKQGKN